MASQMNEGNPSKILSLLSTRERCGVVAPSTRGARGPAQVDHRMKRDVRVEDLSSAIAWNSTRMQNMILSVGPGTPASVLMKPSMSITSSSSHSSDEEMLPSDISEGDQSGDADGEGNDDDASTRMEEEVSRGLRRRRWTRRVLRSVHEAEDDAEAAVSRTMDEQSEEDALEALADDAQMEELLEDKEAEEVERDQQQQDCGEESAPAAGASSSGRRRQRSNSARSEHTSGSIAAEGPATDHDSMMDNLSHDGDAHSSSSSSSSPRTRQWAAREKVTVERPVAPSMRHGGCINTAAWLSCPWRLSLANHADNTLHGGLIVSSSHSSNSAGAFSSNHDGDGNGRDRLYSMDRDESNANYEPSPRARALSSNEECPSQLLTSGDDRTVRFWDVSDAMGGTSPFPGGPATICPFSQSSRLYDAPPDVVRHWKKRSKRGDPIPGAVVPLATLQTGHRENVFHATPVYHQPGKVATCAADGYLRICDIESGSSSSSTIVISPDIDDDAGDLPAGFLRLRSGMCFSHHFLDAHSGLLCSERGLKRFDLRLSPREQPSGSILGGQYSSCKSCAIWSAGSSGVGGGIGEEDFDSAYVFVGSSSGDVALCDLRMTSDTSSRIVQHYRPRCFGPNEPVSVSGIDVSRDKRELLVSYESDQIYSFPIFPDCSSAAGPSVEELASYSAALAPSGTEDDEAAAGAGLLPEFASYGGHLNRFTFLKMAKYAGPNDEYICTGSDSGHAWIYEKASGSVVSLLKADHSTCNGIVPHPTLPLFITYGIDSTAKLWRATQPVGNDIDDSDLGRTKAFHNAEYDASHLVRSWKGTQNKLNLFCDNEIEQENFTLLPDEIPSHDDDDDSIFGGLAGVLFRSVTRFAGRAPMIPYIGNDLVALPRILMQNYFSCVRAFVSGDEEPVKSGIGAFKRRVGLMRLKWQADRLGLKWDPVIPWVMKPKPHAHALEAASAKDEGEPGICPENKYGSSVDLVPDFPGDWIPFDAEMTPEPLAFGMAFNDADYQDFYLERYAKARQHHLQAAATTSSCTLTDDFVLDNNRVETEVTEPSAEEEEKNESDNKPPASREDMDTERELNNPGIQPKGEAKSLQEYRTKARDDVPSPYDATKAWDLLYDTVFLLKEGGNAALSAGAVPLAAHRYDKAIRYCAIAFQRFPEGRLDFLSSHQDALVENGGHEIRWTPLLKALITIRLNLSMTMLRPEVYSPTIAADNARIALLEIKPFATAKGKVMTGEKLAIAREDEPEETYTEAKELQAKAYFRLGNAQSASSDYAAATKSFENSIKSTKDLKGPNAKPEAVVQRRLAEAKKESAKRRKHQRKKFKFAFSAEDDKEKEKEGTEEEEQNVTADTDNDAAAAAAAAAAETEE